MTAPYKDWAAIEKSMIAARERFSKLPAADRQDHADVLRDIQKIESYAHEMVSVAIGESDPYRGRKPESR